MVVFDRADAFAFQNARDDSERQEILNRSQIFVDGKEFGLALNQKAPFDAEAIGKYALPQAVSPSLASREADSRAGSTLVNPKLLPGSGGPTNRMPSMSSLGAGSVLDSHVMAPAPTMPGVTAQDHPVTATPADAEHLQSQFQVQLDALGSVGKAQFHFVDYASPSFAVFQNKMVLQLTLRNTLHFNADTTSIYKRSAQSFDLFLAPQLKDLVDKVPSDASFDGYDFTVVNQIGADPRPASEAIEFVCPRGALREFVDAGITNQQLIDQSIVLVNGVRIALNLQLVE